MSERLVTMLSTEQIAARVKELGVQIGKEYEGRHLVLVCILPEILIAQTGVPFYLGGTSLLIVVSVTLDTVAQIQGHLIATQYEGLIKKSKLRGGKRG